MTDQLIQIEEHFINPGGFHFGAGHLRLRTLLGSCISIVLWHPQRLIGGLCHFMLPGRNEKTHTGLDGRYAEEAFALFEHAMLRHGSRINEYHAKVFGGASMFETRMPAMDIGKRNIACAAELLSRRDITVIASDVGGKCHRKISFDVWNGDVWVSRDNPPWEAP